MNGFIEEFDGHGGKDNNALTGQGFEDFDYDALDVSLSASGAMAAIESLDDEGRRNLHKAIRGILAACANDIRVTRDTLARQRELARIGKRLIWLAWLMDPNLVLPGEPKPSLHLLASRLSCDPACLSPHTAELTRRTGLRNRFSKSRLEPDREWKGQREKQCHHQRQQLKDSRE